MTGGSRLKYGCDRQCADGDCLGQAPSGAARFIFGQPGQSQRVPEGSVARGRLAGLDGGISGSYTARTIRSIRGAELGSKVLRRFMMLETSIVKERGDS
jgi:hypothetical protein